MWLTDCSIHGLRRFGGDEPHRVRFDAKLVCLIGANEAGKSTILDALEIAHSVEAVPASDRTRREGVPDNREIVRLRYRLDDGDREALAQVRRDPDGPQRLQWFVVVRYANGQHNYWAEPELVRDRTERRSVHRTLTERARKDGGPRRTRLPATGMEARATPMLLSRSKRSHRTKVASRAWLRL